MTTRIQRIIATFASLSYLLAVLMPFFAVYAQPSSAEAAELFGDKILICTINGFEWVDVDALASGNKVPSSDKAFKCGLCVLSANGLSVFAAYAPVSLEALVSAVVSEALPLHTQLTGSQRIYAQHLTRAPPAILV